MTQTPAALEACPFEECHNWIPGMAFKYIGDDESMKREVHYFVGHTPIGPWRQVWVAETPGKQRLHWSGFPPDYERWPKYDKTAALAPRDVGALKLEIGNILPADLTPSQIIKFTIDHLASIDAIGGAVEGYVMVPRKAIPEYFTALVKLMVIGDEKAAQRVLEAATAIQAAASNAGTKEEK